MYMIKLVFFGLITLSVRNKIIYYQDKWNENMLSQDGIYEDDYDKIEKHDKLMINKIFDPYFNIKES